MEHHGQAYWAISFHGKRMPGGGIVGYRGPYGVQTEKGPGRRTVSRKTKTEATARLARARAEADGGGAFDADKQTLEDYLKRLLNDSVKNTVKPVTSKSYERRVRVHLSPALGHLRLGRLSPANLQAPYGRKLDAGMFP